MMIRRAASWSESDTISRSVIRNLKTAQILFSQDQCWNMQERLSFFFRFCLQGRMRGLKDDFTCLSLSLVTNRHHIPPSERFLCVV